MSLVAPITLALTLLAAPQTTPPTLDLRIGTPVWITTADGRVVAGDATVVSNNAIEVARPQAGKREVVRLEAIQKIEVASEPLRTKRGALVGGIAGGGFSFLIGAGFNTECHCMGQVARLTAGGALVGAGIGAVIGTALDYVLGSRRVVWER